MTTESPWIEIVKPVLPAEGQRVEFDCADGGSYSGVFRGDAFIAVPHRWIYDPNRVIRWRPIPKPKPELPEFAKLLILKCHGLNWGFAEKEFKSAFRWPHDPPQPGDQRLVVETFGETKTNEQA